MSSFLEKIGLGALFTLMIPFLVLLCAPLALLRAWVLVKLWEWFVVPTFPALPSLNTLQMFCLMMVLGFLMDSPTRTAKTKSEHPWQDLAAVILTPFLTLALGWIVHWGWPLR